MSTPAKVSAAKRALVRAQINMRRASQKELEVKKRVDREDKKLRKAQDHLFKTMAALRLKKHRGY